MSSATSDGRRSVCVVLLSGLGDVVHGLPVVNALKRSHPEWRITWVVEPMPAPMLAGHPAVDEVIVYEKVRGVRGVLDLRRKLKRRSFDLTLNLNYFTKSVWPTLFSGAPRRVGFDWHRCRDRAVWVAANEHLAPHPLQHTQDMLLEFVAHLGIERPTVEWRIPITDAERRAQSDFFAPVGDVPVAAIVPATAIRRKDWFADRYASVVDALEGDFGFRTVLVGGRGEREQRVAREIMERTRANPVWAMGDPIRSMIWQLERSDLVIAPDTGPTHLARALEVPVIGLYGHTNPWRVGPYRKFEDLWVDTYTDPGDPPDPSRYDPKYGRMEQITVRDVLERVERARERYPRRPATTPGGRGGEEP